jgi:hypothetical protein
LRSALYAWDVLWRISIVAQLTCSREASSSADLSGRTKATA